MGRQIPIVILTWRYSTPTAFIFSTRTLVAVAFRAIWRFRLWRYGRRKAAAELCRTPFFCIIWATVKPVNWSPLRSSEIGYPFSAAAARRSLETSGLQGNLPTVSNPSVEWYLDPTRLISVLFSEQRKYGRTCIISVEEKRRSQSFFEILPWIRLTGWQIAFVCYSLLYFRKPAAGASTRCVWYLNLLCLFFFCVSNKPRGA